MIALVLGATIAWPTYPTVRADTPATEAPPTAEATTQPSAETATPTDLPPVAPPPVPVRTPSLQDIQDLATQVQQSTTLDDAQKEEAQSILREARKKLEEWDTWNKRAESFRERSKKAPALLEKLRQQDPTVQPATQPTSQPATTQPTTTQPAAIDSSLESLEAQLRNEQANLDAERARLEQAEKALTQRNTFLAEGSKQIAATREELSKLELEPVKADGPPLVVEARRDRRAASRMLLEAKLAALEAELKFYENFGELMLTERDRAVQSRDALETAVKQLRTRVASLRQLAAEQAKEKAEDVSTRVRRKFPDIEQLIDENKALAEDLAAISEQSTKLASDEQSVADTSKKIDEEFKEAKKKEASAGSSQSYGVLLRSQLGTLPALGEYEDRLARRRSQIEDVQYKVADYSVRLDRLANLEPVINDWVGRIPSGLTEAEQAQVGDEIRRQIELKKENLKKLDSQLRAYAFELGELERALANLIDTTESFRSFIDERILWVRSGRPIGADKFAGLQSALEWFFNAEHWGAFLDAAAEYYATYWFMLIPAFIVVGALLAMRRTIRNHLRAASAKANEPLSTDFKVTLSSCLYTLLLAIPYPLLLWFIGRAFSRVPNLTAPDAADFADAVAGGFYSAAAAALPLLLFFQICRVHGLAGAHLGWDSKSISILRRNLIWFVGASVPVSFVVGMLSDQSVEVHRETFGRDVFILGMLFVTAFTYRVLKPKAGALTQYMIEHPHGRLVQFRYPLYAIFLAIPIAIAIGAAMGYYYTALRLSARCWMTAIIWISASIVYQLLMRWLLLARRKIAIDQAMRKRAEAKAKAEAKAEAERAARREAAGDKPETDAPTKPAPVEEPMINIPSLSQQTRQLIGSFTIIAVVGLTFFVWVSELPALNIFREIQVGDLGVTVADIGLALIAAVVSIIAVRNIPALLEISVLAHLPIDAGTRYAVSSISRYIIGTIGIIVTFGLINIGWSKVQWLVAAVSVGLGFGLQEIFANFVSGLIILFERPIRIGDTVTVGTDTGTISKIRIRATCITDWDNKERIIPNKRFVTDEITNWTLSSEVLRLVIPVGVSYSSDPRQVRDVLMDVIKANGKSLDDPAPKVYFLGFGDSALNFECRMHFRNFDDLLLGRHQLYTEIFEACRREGIEIAFPQRDIHIRSINATLPLMRERGRPGKLEVREAPDAEDGA